MSSQTILDGEARQQALDAVHEIDAALHDRSPDDIADASLSCGTAGLAVLCAYLARADLDDGENAAQFLARSLDALAAAPMSPSLYGGFTGIAWTTAHLEAQLGDGSRGAQ